MPHWFRELEVLMRSADAMKLICRGTNEAVSKSYTRSLKLIDPKICPRRQHRWELTVPDASSKVQIALCQPSCIPTLLPVPSRETSECTTSSRDVIPRISNNLTKNHFLKQAKIGRL